MTKSQLAFEAQFANNIPINKDGTYCYKQADPDLAVWDKAWQASRKAALESILLLSKNQQSGLYDSEYHRGWRDASIQIENLTKRLLNE
jgi:hypothetical protein